MTEEVAKLRNQKQLLLKKIRELEDQAANSGLLERQIEISGETTELGEKYYGPLLSTYMIDMLKREKDRTPLSEPTSEENDSHSGESRPDESDRDDSDESGQAKKKLPFLMAPGTSKSDNLAVLIFLVSHFFSLARYANFISQPLVLNFVKNNCLIKEDEWENDDDLLLLHMILILLLRQITPQEYDKSGLSSSPITSMTDLTREVTRLIEKILFPGFMRLRHNLLNESVVTVQAHILCIEWHVIEGQYEEAWSMMFHSCSIAYSIGLHVMFNLRTASKAKDKTARQIAEITEGKGKASNDEDKEDTTNLSDEEHDFDDYRIARFKVWFALKHISGQLCSILGRPSPILIQVNRLVLLSAGSIGLTQMGLDRKETQSHLKMGLSECIRLANEMLIESFMVNFTLNDIQQLEVRFQEESNDLTWFASAEYQKSIEGKENEINQYSDIPLHVCKTEALADLVALHVNRAKLLQPFMSQFISGADNDYLLNALCESTTEFLNCSLAFVKVFLQNHVPKFVNSEGKIVSDVRLRGSLKSHYPFINTFIYQGMVVLFTIFSSKTAELLTEPYVDFVKGTRSMLTDILEINFLCQDLLQQKVIFWPKPINFLANKNIQYAKQICERFKESLDIRSLNSDVLIGSDITESDSVLGFNTEDPFWITNPENLPYYLNYPSEDDMQLQPNFAEDKTASNEDYQIPLLLVTTEQHTAPQEQQPAHLSGFVSQTGVPAQSYLDLQQPVPVLSENIRDPQVSATSNAPSYVSGGFQSAPVTTSALTSLEPSTVDQTFEVASISSGLDALADLKPSLA